MLALRIEGKFHWGFWVRYPETSKVQSSLTIPPPTTLMGALTYPLITLNQIKGFNGEILENEIASPVKYFEDYFYAASMYYKSGYKGFYVEDISKYITLHFQMKTIDGKIDELAIKLEKEFPNKVSLDKKNRIITIDNKVRIYPFGSSWKIEGDESIMYKVISLIEDEYFVQRRYLQKYRSGAIISGKVYHPSEFVACYLIDEQKFEELLGQNWQSILVYSSYNITRIGSKESIVSIQNVSLNKVEELSKNEIKTLFYFPRDYVEEILSHEKFYVESFWKEGWGMNYPRIVFEYVIPGNKNPIYSEAVNVRVKKDVKAIKVSNVEDEIMLVK